MNAIIGADNSMDTYYFSVDRAAHLDYCDIVFTSVNEELRGERNATEMRNLVTDDGVDLIKKTSNK